MDSDDISALAALASAFFAGWSYYMSRKTHAELKANEKLIFGKPHNPSFISLADHRDCVLEIPIHNVSTSTRAFITAVQAFNQRGEPIEMSWSGATDNLGNLSIAGDVLKIESSANLYLRVNDGECINYLCIKLFHTFAKSAQVLVFDKYADMHE